MIAFRAPLNIYYDRGCPLCESEMTQLQAHAPAGSIELIDCSAPDFSDAAASAQGLSSELMMRRIRAQDANGNWFADVDVFAIAYGLAGSRAIASLLQNRFLKPLFRWAYPLIADNRQILSRLGLQRIFMPILRLLLTRQLRRTTSCADETCAKPHRGSGD